jgi:hypothetical protein
MHTYILLGTNLDSDELWHSAELSWTNSSKYATDSAYVLDPKWIDGLASLG